MASLVVSRRALQLALAGAGVSAALLAWYLRWRAARRQQQRRSRLDHDGIGGSGDLMLDYPPINGCCGCACHQVVLGGAATPAAVAAAPPTCGSRQSRKFSSKRGSVRSGGSHRRLRLDEVDIVAAETCNGLDGTRSGIEALHRVIADLETSLESFDGLSSPAGAFDGVRGGSGGESELLAELRNLLETAYRIRERAKQRALAVDEAYLPSTDVSDEDSDADSFVSALEQLDISDLDDQMRLAKCDSAHLYRAALLELENGSVPFRKLRTGTLGCSTDTEYLARLHCVRLAMDQLMADRASANWFRVTGRELGALLLDRLGCDVQPFELAYRELLQFLDSPEATEAIRRDLSPKGVRVFGLYDIAFDYMLLDAFEELASPPPSIVSVLQNRWLSAGFKRSALDSTVWTLVLAKRKMLGGARGFSYHFYGLVASLGPALAWGFLGPDQRANKICEALRKAATQFAEDVFSPQRVRFTTVDDLADDVLTCAQRSVRSLRERLAECD